MSEQCSSVVVKDVNTVIKVGKMTQRQWQEVFSIVRKEQKELFSGLFDQDRYDELSKILDDLYPIAYRKGENHDIR